MIQELHSTIQEPQKLEKQSFVIEIAEQVGPVIEKQSSEHSKEEIEKVNEQSSNNLLNENADKQQAVKQRTKDDLAILKQDDQQHEAEIKADSKNIFNVQPPSPQNEHKQNQQSLQFKLKEPEVEAQIEANHQQILHLQNGEADNIDIEQHQQIVFEHEEDKIQKIDEIQKKTEVAPKDNEEESVQIGHNQAITIEEPKKQQQPIEDKFEIEEQERKKIASDVYEQIQTDENKQIKGDNQSTPHQQNLVKSKDHSLISPQTIRLHGEKSQIILSNQIKNMQPHKEDTNQIQQNSYVPLNQNKTQKRDDSESMDKKELLDHFEGRQQQIMSKEIQINDLLDKQQISASSKMAEAPTEEAKIQNVINDSHQYHEIKAQQPDQIKSSKKQAEKQEYEIGLRQQPPLFSPQPQQVRNQHFIQKQLKDKEVIDPSMEQQHVKTLTEIVNCHHQQNLIVQDQNIPSQHKQQKDQNYQPRQPIEAQTGSYQQQVKQSQASEKKEDLELNAIQKQEINHNEYKQQEAQDIIVNEESKIQAKREENPLIQEPYHPQQTRIELAQRREEKQANLQENLEPTKVQNKNPQIQSHVKDDAVPYFQHVNQEQERQAKVQEKIQELHEDKKQSKDFESNQPQFAVQEVRIGLQTNEKQRYRLNTQKVDTIPEEKDKNQQIVEFIEFNQQQKIQPAKEPEQINQLVQKNIVKEVKQTNKEDNPLNVTFSPSKQVEKQNQQQQSTIEITARKKRLPEIQQSPVPKQGVGKIARKIVSEKRVQDVIEDLKKHEKLLEKSQGEKRPSSRRKTIDASKLEHIGLRSNIINVTIGELLSKNEQTQAADKLLDEIDQLKKKLFQLEKKKELAALAESDKTGDVQRQAKQVLLSNKSNKKQCPGKIYRRQSNYSRVTEQVQTYGAHFSTAEKFSSAIVNPATISSAPRQRFSSTQDISGPKSISKQHQIDNKTGPILFRVKKNNKLHGTFDFNSNQREFGFTKSKQFESEDKCFQARRQNQFQKLQFAQAEKFNILLRPVLRTMTFNEDFQEKTDAFFIQMSKQLPRKDWTQEDLVQTAKSTFKRFGVNIQAQKNLTLSVKKYKNCVSFILDSNRTVLWYYQGKFYYGGWKINSSGQGQKNGWGYDYSPGKYVYSGSFLENKRDGYGVIKLLTRQNDIIYEGEWKNGFKHGQGKQREPDGSEYIGGWTQGKKSGKGKIKGLQNQYFQGEFLNGIKNGQGSEKFKNGDSYQGNYYDGKFHGMGVYIWANHSRYEGEFRDGSRNGNGIWISNIKQENSDRYEGQYKNDRKNGFGVYRWKDGTVYQGEFLNDLKHGEGIVSYGDGKSTKLQWFEGNVVPKQASDKPRSGAKRSISKSSSKKNEKHPETKAPLIKFKVGSNQSKSKPVRMSLGIQQM